VQHAELEYSREKANAFGGSLSRCPQLRGVSMYKFGPLSGRNCVALPECTMIGLHREETMRCLDILHAPKLETLGVQAAYELETLCVCDLAGVTAADALELNASRSASFAREQDARPAEEFNAALEAFVMAHEGQTQGGGGGKKKGKKEKREKLPVLTIDRTNMDLPRATIAKLKKNSRVLLIGTGTGGYGMGSEDGFDIEEEFDVEFAAQQQKEIVARMLGVTPDQIHLGPSGR
jgi:hypothetical protein